MLRRLILLAATAGVLLAACSEPPSPPPNGDLGNADAARDELVDPIVAEGTGLGQCAETFSVQSLRERGFAFDGTVTSIEEPGAMDAPYEVGFRVARWFHGGSGPTVSLTTYDVSGMSLVGDLGLAIGDRILASGDEDVLWGCGFSMTYSSADAAVFEETFA